MDLTVLLLPKKLINIILLFRFSFVFVFCLKKAHSIFFIYLFMIIIMTNDKYIYSKNEHFYKSEI